MIPSPLALAVLVGWAASGLAPGLWPATAAAWQAAGVGLVLAFLVDGVRAWRTPCPVVRREAPPVVSMQSTAPVTLAFENGGRRALRVAVHDHVPDRLETDAFPHALTLPAGEGATWSYRVRPLERGTARFGGVELRVRSPWWLFERRHLAAAGAETTVRVFPDFDAVRRYELLAVSHRTSQLGIKRRPRRGDGLDFHQLREYRAGDALRQVDWKATARLRRPISREYQDERDQQILLVLDCGRRMRTRDGRRSHQDAALDAALLVANVALRQGDAVGFATFGGLDRWLPPRKGRTQLGRILEGLFDVHAQPRASDPLAAAAALMERVPKRSLVVWVSNLRDEDGSELEAALHLLARRHLVLLASLRETALDRGRDAPIESRDDALRVAAIHHYLGERRRAHARLAAGDALLLDCAPEQLPVALVNGYLEVKAAGLL